jgi:hypothetical protein
MIFATTSHRSRERLAVLLGKITYYWKHDDCGRFIVVEDEDGIKKVTTVKGVSKCRDQDRSHYHACWG